MEFDALSDPFYQNDTAQFSIDRPITVRKSTTSPISSTVRPHFHNTLEIVYFYDGKGGSVTIDGVVHRYRAKEIVMVRPYAMHMFDLASRGQHFLLCKIETSYLNALFDNSIFAGEIHSVIDALCRLTPVQRPTPGFLRIITSMRDNDRTGVIGRLLLLAAEIKPMSTAEKKDAGASAFGHLLAYLDKHYSSRIRLSDAASHTGMSKFYFAHRFKAIYGVSFVDFLTKIRLTKAENLLRYSRRTVGDIALSVGFSDLAYFTRMFKEIQG